MARTGRLAAIPLLLTLAVAQSPAPSSASLRADDGPYRVEVRIDGRPAESWHHRGETWVLGRLGERYEIRVTNRSGRRVEVVVSVDGRDVIDGGTGGWRSRRGYLVDPWGSIDIDGFRISRDETAAFRFSSVADSYAARTGSARDVGVIGVAVFPERPRPVVRRRLAETEAGGSAAADAVGEEKSAAPSSRPGLGTGYGEARDSPVVEVPFERADPSRPAAVLGLRYDDAAGLRAQGIRIERGRREDERERRRRADPFPAERGFAPPPPGWDRGRHDH